MDSIIKNDRKQNLKIFQGMERQNSFSKYSGELDQIFGDNCFNKFYTRLLSGKKSRPNYQNNYYTDNSNVKYNYNSQSGNFDLLNYKKFIHSLKKESELEELKRKEYMKQFKLIKDEDEEKIKQRKLSARKKKKFPEVPSIGWYHPNYNAIRKNEPRIYIGEGYFSKRKKEENNKLNFNELLNDKSESQSGNVSQIRSRKVSAHKRGNSDNNNNFNTIGNEKENYNIYNFERRKNNALRFSKYSWRKPIVSESITSKIVSNSEVKDSFSSDNIKGLVEFNKMSSNLNIGSFIPKKSLIPPIGFYKPRYESIETKTPEIYFVKKNPVITKQMRLKKLLYDYNVSKDYELVPNLNS